MLAVVNSCTPYIIIYINISSNSLLTTVNRRSIIPNKNNNNLYKTKDSHVLYGDMSDSSLKELIKNTASMRKRSSAGRDLQEMRNEYRRRMSVRFARRKKRAYTKDVPMLENPVEAVKFNGRTVKE